MYRLGMGHLRTQIFQMSTWSTRAQAIMKRQMSWWTWPATFTNSSFKATCFALHFIRTTLLATLARVDRGHPVAGTVHLCWTNPSSVDSYLYLKSALWDPLELPCCLYGSMSNSLRGKLCPELFAVSLLNSRQFHAISSAACLNCPRSRTWVPVDFGTLNASTSRHVGDLMSLIDLKCKGLGIK